MFDKNKVIDIAESIPGKKGIIVENKDGIRLIDYNGDEVFPSASTIKLFILWSLYTKIQNGELNRDDLIAINDFEKVGGCGILTQLKTANLSLSLRDIADLMITLSDNVATNILIDTVGMDFINSEMKKYGFNNSKLERHMMDSEAKARGYDNYTSPEDQVKILKKIENDEKIEEVHRKEMIEILGNQILVNHAAQYLPLDYKFYHKTGNLDSTLHDSGILVTPNNKYYITILTDELEDIVEGMKVMNLIGEEIFKQIKISEKE